MSLRPLVVLTMFGPQDHVIMGSGSLSARCCLHELSTVGNEIGRRSAED